MVLMLLMMSNLTIMTMMMILMMIRPGEGDTFCWLASQIIQSFNHSISQSFNHSIIQSFNHKPLPCSCLSKAFEDQFFQFCCHSRLPSWSRQTMSRDIVRALHHGHAKPCDVTLCPYKVWGRVRRSRLARVRFSMSRYEVGLEFGWSSVGVRLEFGRSPCWV